MDEDDEDIGLATWTVFNPKVDGRGAPGLVPASRTLSETIVRAPPPLRKPLGAGPTHAAGAPSPPPHTAPSASILAGGFMGGLDDDDERMQAFVLELAAESAKISREARARESTLPDIDDPYEATFPVHASVACCRFHDWGVRESRAYYEKAVAMQADTREKMWHAYRLDVIPPGRDGSSLAWFIGTTEHIDEDIPLLVNYIITGEAKRRVSDAEGASEFSKYVLVIQVCHAWYRRTQSLDFLHFKVLSKESQLLNLSSRRHEEIVCIEAETIESSSAWFTPGSVSSGLGGLNYWNPASTSVQASWGVSLVFLRGVLGDNVERYKHKTVREVYEDVLRPMAQGATSFVEYLKRHLPQHVHEKVDWFVSPACHECNWYKMIHDGGISIHSRDPPPIQKGNRFIYLDLFH